MQRLGLVCGLLLACCGVPEKTPEEAAVIDAEIVAVEEQHIVPIFEKHDVKQETASNYLQACRQLRIGMLTGGTNWRGIMEDIAVYGFNALLSLLGLGGVGVAVKRSGIVGRLIGLIAGLFTRKKV